MKKLCLIIFSFLILCALPVVYSQKSTPEYKYFAIPDKIIIYERRKPTTIWKGSDSFKKILELTDERFSGKIDSYLLAIDMKELNQMEKLETMLEFVYTNMQVTEYDHETKFSKKYKRLLMPLTGKFSNCVFFDDGSNTSSGPISSLTFPEDINKFLQVSRR